MKASLDDLFAKKKKEIAKVEPNEEKLKERKKAKL